MHFDDPRHKALIQQLLEQVQVPFGATETIADLKRALSQATTGPRADGPGTAPQTDTGAE